MTCKLFSNVRKMTNVFCAGILCVTISVLALRLTVFSDMATVAAPPKETLSHILTSEQDGYKLNGRVYFSAADAKGDIFVQNLEGNEFIINVDFTLKDSGKSILTTGFIKPGNSLNSTRMNPVGQKLQNGVYDCIAEITAYDPDTLKSVGSATENIQVYIAERPEKAGK